MSASSLYAKILLENLLSEKEMEILSVLLNDDIDPDQKLKILTGEDTDV